MKKRTRYRSPFHRRQSLESELAIAIVVVGWSAFIVGFALLEILY